MSERDQHNRRRCLTPGCNPVMHGDEQAAAHATKTGHRTAKWPIRSPAGKRKARQRNKSGYYDQYNVGAKSAEARGIRRDRGNDMDGALAQGEDGESYWGRS